MTIANQAGFLARLQQALSALPPSERADILNDYHSHFAEGVASGRSEADIIAVFGHSW